MVAKFYICLTEHVTCILEYVLYDIILLPEEDEYEDKSIFIIII